jgi:asparagine synthase (glutamine-hydrolysing)
MDRLCVVAAKTARGRRIVAERQAALWPSTFPALAEPAWWIEADAGLALYGASTLADGQGVRSALAVAGQCLPRGPDRAGAGAAADTLLATLLCRGTGVLDSAVGAFALALWDADRQELWLARDPLGQRQLFVREDADLLIACSELAPLLSDTGFCCELDFESAYHYLSFGTPLPGRTLARRVHQVLAGHVLAWRPRLAAISQRYFTPLWSEGRKVVDDAGRAEVASALDTAIDARVVAGHQALLLSGGVDSSYLALGVAARHGPERLEAYTIEFAPPFSANEGNYAALVAREAGIRHHRVPFDTAQAGACLATVLQAAQPCSAWACITHEHLLQRIRGDGHANLLTGLGADEVFGGYWKFFESYDLLRRHDEAWLLGERLDAFDGLLWSAAPARRALFSGIPRFFDDASLRQGLELPYARWDRVGPLAAFYRECRRLKPDAHLFELMVAHECAHRVPDLLHAGFEPIARHHGVTTSLPFLDPTVVRHACALGATERFWLKDGRWKNKKVLRDIAARCVPREILDRKPTSYTAAFGLWMADPSFSQPLKRRWRASRLWTLGLVKGGWLDQIESVVDTLHSRSGALAFRSLDQFWILVTLAAWFDRWVDRAHEEASA